MKEPAQRWARRKKDIYNLENGIVNIYHMSDDFKDFRVKTFDDDMIGWIDFVCNARDGSAEYQQYDLIIGNVANDKVFRVVDMYHNGIWDRDRALKEIRVYPKYNQIAFVTQNAIDQLLVFERFEEV